MNLGLDGRVALVAGGSAGLGRATAIALAREGARVFLCSRSRTRAETAAREIAARTRAQVAGMAADVENAGACRRWVGAALKRWGQIDILVHNAGGPPHGDFDELDETQWEEGLRRNFLSAVRLSRLVLPAMKRAQWGRLVFIASTSAKHPIDGLSISNAVRAGILGLSKSIANEAGPCGVTANVVCPGYTTTERLAELAQKTSKGSGLTPEAVYRRWAENVPLRRLGKPEEVADAIAYLASERAGYVTGTVLAVDGGRIASPF